MYKAVPSSKYQLIQVSDEQRRQEEREFDSLKIQLRQKFEFKSSPADKFQELINQGKIEEEIDQKMKEHDEKMEQKRQERMLTSFASAEMVDMVDTSENLTNSSPISLTSKYP